MVHTTRYKLQNLINIKGQSVYVVGKFQNRKRIHIIHETKKYIGSYLAGKKKM